MLYHTQTIDNKNSGWPKGPMSPAAKPDWSAVPSLGSVMSDTAPCTRYCELKKMWWEAKYHLFSLCKVYFLLDK